MNLPLQRPEPAPGAQELVPRATESSGAGALHGPGTVAWSGSRTSQPSGQVSLLDSSACDTGQLSRQVSPSNPPTGQPAGQVSVLDGSAPLDKSASQTGQPPGQISPTGQVNLLKVNLPDRSPFQTDQPYEHVNFTDQPPGQGSFPDRSISKTGQLSGQVSFPDMSSTWTGQLPDKFAFGQPPRWGSLQTDLRELPRQVGLQCRSAGQTC